MSKGMLRWVRLDRKVNTWRGDISRCRKSDGRRFGGIGGRLERKL